MNFHVRKTASLLLACTMAISFASCAFLGSGTNKKEIIEAADAFAGALLKQDTDKILKLVDSQTRKKTDAAFVLTVLFDEDSYTEDQNKFNEAVSDTITYEIDEDSVKVKKDEASVNVTFTMVDYEKALKDEDITDIADVIDALEDCDDVKEVEITFEFEMEDDDWVITNFEDDSYADLYEFYDYELDLKPDLESLIDHTEIDAGSYYVVLCIYFTEDITDYAEDVTYDAYRDGELIASDMPVYYYEGYISCDYTIDPAYNLDAGDYTIEAKYDGEVFTIGEITVEETESDIVPTADAEGVDYNFDVDATGELAGYVVAVDWWGDDGEYCYSNAPQGVEYDVYFSSDITEEQILGITYTCYNPDYGPIVEDQPIEYNRTNIDDGYPNVDGYYFIYCGFFDDDVLEPGTYYVDVYNPDGTLLLHDCCDVFD